MAVSLTLQEVAQQQALAEGYMYGPTPTVNNANLNTHKAMERLPFTLSIVT
jgi:uncharacterized lipoprotein YajG